MLLLSANYFSIFTRFYASLEFCFKSAYLNRLCYDDSGMYGIKYFLRGYDFYRRRGIPRKKCYFCPACDKFARRSSNVYFMRIATGR